MDIRDQRDLPASLRSCRVEAAGPAATGSVFVLCGEQQPVARAYLDALDRAGLRVHQCTSAAAVARLPQHERLIAGLLDLRHVDEDAAIGDIESLADRLPSVRLVALVERGAPVLPALVRLLQQRLIYDLHILPMDLDQVLMSFSHIKQLVEIEALARREPPRIEPSETYLVGSCPAMQKVFGAIRKIAGINVPVLITGESGTGKELVARAVHERSEFGGGPFVAINCAGISPTLIQSELFGHEKGAFTGAHQRKIGHIEAAAGGTCFLDEIGDLPVEVQGHLLRFLQEGTIQRLGRTQPIPVRTRIVTATNVDLEIGINSGRFRRDLFYRINGFTIDLPPLRERGEDIELLASYFLRKFAGELGRPVTGFRRSAIVAMRSYDWPGNVRELISSVRRAVVMAGSGLISAADLGIAEAQPTGERPLPTLEEARNEAEEKLIRRTLELNAFNIQRTARQLDISRMTLYRLMEKFGMSGTTP